MSFLSKSTKKIEIWTKTLTFLSKCGSKTPDLDKNPFSEGGGHYYKSNYYLCNNYKSNNHNKIKQSVYLRIYITFVVSKPYTMQVLKSNI